MSAGRSLRTCRSGASAVEFALILPVLLLFVFGSIETAIVLFIRSSMESAVLEASRYGITGGKDGMSRAERVMQILGERTYGLLDPDTVRLETLIYDDFDDVGKPEPFVDANGSRFYEPGESFTDVNGNGTWDPDMGKAGLGGRNAVVVYRLSYAWGIVTPMVREAVGGSVMNVASVAVRNEPFK